MQFINKLDQKQISEYETKKFKAISDLIGLAIDNCTEQHSWVNIRLGVYQNIKNVNSALKQHEEIGEHADRREVDNLNLHKNKIVNLLEYMQNEY